MADTWLESVPYGGFAGGTPESHALAQVGQGAMSAHPDEGQTTIALVGGLVLITGGAAALGWFLVHSKMGALVGALLGLGYSAANLAANASTLATENARLQQAAAAASGAQSGGGAGAIAARHGGSR